jgi:acetyltransferase
VPAADERAIRLVLVKLSQLAADVPEIRELDINPFLADQNGVIAVDVKLRPHELPLPDRRWPWQRLGRCRL